MTATKTRPVSIRFSEAALAKADGWAEHENTSRSAIIEAQLLAMPDPPPKKPKPAPKPKKPPKALSPQEVVDEGKAVLASLKKPKSTPEPLKAGQMVSLPEQRAFNPQPKRKWGSK